MAAASTTVCFAGPKPRILTRPSTATIMLAGLRSRCTDAGRVGRCHAISDLHRHVQERADGDWPTFDDRRQRLAGDELRRHIEDAVVGANVVDAEDVRMIQRGRGVRFLLEPGAAFGVGRNVGGRTLSATSRRSRMSRAR